MHEAFDNGRAVQIKQLYGKDAEVYKDVYPGGCPVCRRLYLISGEIGTEPIVFKLSTLLANGTNIGVKQANAKPVIGATHPYCRCTLNVKPPNTEWNQELKQFVLKEIDKKTLSKRVRERKARGKVIIEKAFDLAEQMRKQDEELFDMEQAIKKAKEMDRKIEKLKHKKQIEG